MYKRQWVEGKWCTSLVLDPEPGEPTCRLVWVRGTFSGPRVWVPGATEEYYRELEDMKREHASQQKHKGKYEDHPEPVLEGCPTINAFMGDCWWDDGKPRETCTLSVRLLSDGVQVSLNDKELRRSISTNAKDVATALSMMEGHVANGNAPWRPWGRQKS